MNCSTEFEGHYTQETTLDQQKDTLGLPSMRKRRRSMECSDENQNISECVEVVKEGVKVVEETPPGMMTSLWRAPVLTFKTVAHVVHGSFILLKSLVPESSIPKVEEEDEEDKSENGTHKLLLPTNAVKVENKKQS